MSIEALPHAPMEGGSVPAGPRRRILVPYISLASFIEQDLAALRSRYDVELVPCRPAWRIGKALGACRRADLMFCWFGSVRFLPLALAARLLRRPVVVVTGGYDVASVPEIRYGNMRPGLARVLGRWLFRLTDLAVCYSRSAAAEASQNAGVPAARARIVPLGFDGERLGSRVDRAAKEPLVLTVAGIDDTTIYRKGLLAVAQTSRLLPEVQFVIAGASEPAALARLRALAGPNVTFAGRVGDDELLELYRRATVYFQPSLHEAFACSVAEAMLFECIPVVTRRYSLPEVVGDCGYYVEPSDYAGMAAAVRQALAAPPPGSESPRDRVLREFPASRRERALFSLLEELHG